MALGLIIVFIILILLDIAVFILFGILYRNLKTCEKSESVYCPSMYCNTEDVDCGHLPYRVDTSGKKVCQQYLISQAAPTYST